MGCIRDYLKDVTDKEKIDVFGAMTEPNLFLPKYNNDRIRLQQGALIFSALFVVDDKQTDDYKKLLDDLKSNSSLLKNNPENDLNKFVFYNTPQPLDDFFSNEIFTIESADCKKQIIKELNNYGINEATVYPEPEHQMNYVKWYCTTYKY